MDSELPRVSVLIPTYNYAEYLGASIDSVLGQGYPIDRMQVIVVDDGSVDDTPAVAASFGDRITYIRQENQGLRGTMNTLLAAATGELIALESGDDVWLPGRLRAQVAEFVARPSLGLLYGDMRVIGPAGETLAESFWELAGIAPVRGRPLVSLMRRNVVSGGTLMVRASLRGEFEPLPAFCAWEDWWIALRVAQVAEIDYLTQPLLGYRRHDRNMNLGADHARQLANAAHELPLRRWMLTGLESCAVAAGDWLDVWREWDTAARWIASSRGDGLQDLMPVSDADRRSCAEAIRRVGEHLAASELDAAAREAVRALGHDPFATGSREALDAVTAVLGGRGHLVALGARGFVTLADGEELLDCPSLLTAYGRVFAGCDDASLVVRISSERVSELAALVDDAGLGGADGPDLIGIPQPAGAPEFSSQVTACGHAVLSTRAATGRLSLLPRADAQSVTRLRALAERRWAQAAA